VSPLTADVAAPRPGPYHSGRHLYACAHFAPPFDSRREGLGFALPVRRAPSAGANNFGTVGRALRTATRKRDESFLKAHASAYGAFGKDRLNPPNG
jgi:hypothetical protein